MLMAASEAGCGNGVGEGTYVWGLTEGAACFGCLECREASRWLNCVDPGRGQLVGPKRGMLRPAWGRRSAGRSSSYGRRLEGAADRPGRSCIPF